MSTIKAPSKKAPVFQAAGCRTQAGIARSGLVAAVFALVLQLGGCAYFQDLGSDADGSPQAVSAPTAATVAPGPVAGSIETSAEPAGQDTEAPDSLVFPGTGQRINARAALAVPHRASEGEVSLNFELTPIAEVVKTVLGDMLGLNYVLDENVSGAVSMRTTRPIGREALLPTLEGLLQVNGAALIRNGEFYEVIAAGDGGVPRSLRPASRLDVSRGFQALVVPLQYIGAEAMAKILEPLKSAKTTVIVDAARNILLLVGAHGELVNMRQTINIFDVDQIQGKSVGLFHLDHVDAPTLLEELKVVFGDPELGSLAGAVEFSALERLNALLVVTTQERYLRQAETWVRRLDRAVDTHGANMYVYYVQNGKAENLAEILNQLFDSKRKTELSRAARSTARRPSTGTSEKVGEGTKKVSSAAKTTTTGAGGSLDVGDVTIIPDTENNALVILGSPSDYAEIERAVKRLDILPLQVLVEATIVEVTLDDELQYGLQWFFKNNHGRFDSIGGLNIPADADLSSGLGSALNPANFTYAIFDAAGTRAVLNAVAGDSRLDVLSSPSLMVLDNQKASIRVGDQVPVRTSESTNTNSDNFNVTSQIQYRDTGVTLEVTPRVNAGGVVVLELTQRVDDVDETDTSGIDSPTIIQREITTSIAVQSGETIVLGGLIRENRQSAAQGIPWLKDVPFAGALFGGKEKSTTKTELVVMIKPVAVSNRDDARNVTDEYRRKMQSIDFSNLDRRLSGP